MSRLLDNNYVSVNFLTVFIDTCTLHIPVETIMERLMIAYEESKIIQKTRKEILKDSDPEATSCSSIGSSGMGKDSVQHCGSTGSSSAPGMSSVVHDDAATAMRLKSSHYAASVCSTASSQLSLTGSETAKDIDTHATAEESNDSDKGSEYGEVRSVCGSESGYSMSSLQFNCMMESNKSGTQFGNYSTKMIKIVRLWARRHPLDFVEPILNKSLMDFMQKVRDDPTSSQSEKYAIESMDVLLCKKLSEKASIKNKVLNMLQSRIHSIPQMNDKWASQVIANQLTLIDCQYLSCLDSRELLETSWMGADKEDKAPNVLSCIHNFNKVSNLVAYDILRRTDPSSRVGAMEKWLSVAKKCMALQNHNSSLVILSTFNLSAIFRLMKSHKLSKKAQGIYTNLSELMCSTGQYAKYRDMTKRCKPPCIPFLGAYLGALCQIESSLKTRLVDGRLNYEKFVKLSNLLQEIVPFTDSEYDLERNEEVSNFILYGERKSDDEIYQMSLAVQPKDEGQREKVKLSKFNLP